MHNVVFLFDLDGVLVLPGGYRAAVRATVDYFARWLDMPARLPAEDDLAIFESQGITGEWDMIPLSLALILEAAASAWDLKADQGFRSLADLRAVLQQARRSDGELLVNYAGAIRRLGAYLKVGEAPADTLLALCQSGQADDIFPHFAGQGALADLLAHTRRLEHSATTRIFEQFVLGHTVFTQAFQMPAEIESESYLAAYDRALLLSDLHDRLLNLRQQGTLKMAAYTARPSAPHQPEQARHAMFAPEAEMALGLVGFESLPLVGYGQMGGCALGLGLNEDALIKPAPYHSMAAIAAAWTGDRRAALAWARSVFQYFERRGPKPVLGGLPDQLEVHIFEDSPIGMAGGKAAVDHLRDLGLAVDLRLWGVASHAEKAAALRALGAQVFPDVNRAVEQALAGHSARSDS